MKSLIIGIFYPVSQFGHQILCGIEYIADPCRERIGEFTLLENIQVRPELKIIGGVFALYPGQGRPPIVNAQAKDIPLPADLKSEIRLFREGSGAIGQAWRQGNIGLCEASV